MVIRDLSAWEGRPQEHREEIRIAFVTDRFMAAVFDFLIFSPVISFCIAGFIKKIKTYMLLDPQSNEASIIWVLCILVSACLVIFLQAVFLYFWQATPGQRFMQLKVISYPGRFAALSFSQCLLRSLMWAGSFVFFAAPFLDVIGHPLRRAFHERASDTLVITLKEDYDLGPLPIERRFVGSWMRMFFLALFLMAGVYTLKTYNLVQEGRFTATGAEKSFLCSQLPTDTYSGAHRLDVAISMFLSDEVTGECLDKEAEYSLWNAGPTESSEKSWAYLARALVTEDKTEQDLYFEKACEADKKAEVCTVANYIAEEPKVNGDTLRRHGLVSVTSRFLLLDEVMDQNNFLSAALLIKDLQSEVLLKSALEKRYVRTAWALQEYLHRTERNFGRSPASENTREEAAAVLEKFKEKYGVK